MKLTEHLYTVLQGFGAGAIIMAYVANYNRSQLPLAILCMIISILLRIGILFKINK